MKTFADLVIEAEFTVQEIAYLGDNLRRLIELVRADERERLLDGVEIPKPILVVSLGSSGKDFFNIDQLRETVATAVARKDAEIEHLKDKLDSSVHGHNQIFELCQVLETERDALKVEVKRLTEERESWRRVCEKITTERDALKAEVDELKKPWVGLTDDEIKAIIGPWGSTPVKGYTRELFDKIEAKLKEKNT